MIDFGWTHALSGISLAELKRFLVSTGFHSLGAWGPYLERYHLSHDDGDFDVLVPTTGDIDDYQDRLRDAVLDLSNAVSADPAALVRKISLSNYKLFRLRAHPGMEISSLPFDEGYALLSNSKNLIKASAVSAFSSRHRKVIRGRNLAAVETYMDKVRIGQSEVGSYVFNLLLPSEEDLFDQPNFSEKPQDSVLVSLQRSIKLAEEMSETNRVPAADQLRIAGMSANFCEALYHIIDWSENVILELSSVGSEEDFSSSYKFSRNSLSVLERTVTKLTPEEQPEKKTIHGTITRLSEPASRRRGSIDLLTKINGRKRSVRVAFGPDERDIIIMAFKDKSSRLLTVTGHLKTERNGHLVLEEPENFDASKRGSLL